MAGNNQNLGSMFGEDMATASLMVGLSFGNAGVGAVHALAYPLGAKFHIPHGVSNALLLPFVIKWNTLSCLDQFVEMSTALSTPVSQDDDAEAIADKVIEQLHNLCTTVGIPKGLHSVGIKKQDIAELATEAIKVERLLRNNPRRLSVSDIEQIYQEAF
jgi:alcohol dehydrogenase class IV